MNAIAKAVAAAADFDRSKGAIAAGRLQATQFSWLEPSSIPSRQWLYRPYYIRQFLSLTVSTGGVGKSSLVIAEALAMVSGKALLGVDPERPLRVWYWNGEDPLDELHRRVVAAIKHHGLSPDDIGDRLFVDSGRMLSIVVASDGKSGATAVDETVVTAVMEEIKTRAIDVLIIDPFVSAHRVGENSNGGIERVAKAFSQIADQANCAVMLVHHSRKTGGAAATVDDGRGASALLAAARSARSLNTMSDTEADNADIDERERRLHFRADVGKANLTAPPEGADWYRIVSVGLENPRPGQDWDEGDQVGAVEKWEYPVLERLDISAADIRRALDAVSVDGPWRLDQRAKNWVGMPIADALGLGRERPVERKVVAGIVKDWVRLGHLKVVHKRDEKARKEYSYCEVGEFAPV